MLTIINCSSYKRKDLADHNAIRNIKILAYGGHPVPGNFDRNLSWMKQENSTPKAFLSHIDRSIYVVQYVRELSGV